MINHNWAIDFEFRKKNSSHFILYFPNKLNIYSLESIA